MNPYPRRWLVILLPLAVAIGAIAQRSDEKARTDSLPKEVRGYKVHRAHVEFKRANEPDRKKSDKKADNKGSEEREYDEQEPLLVHLGEPELVSVTGLGITFDVPVILDPVKQQGEVDRLVFEDMVINDVPINLEDYVHRFKLPNKESLTLAPPLRIFVSTPQAVIRTIDEIMNSKEHWQVTGRVYLCGHFKKYLFRFKRAVPVDLNRAIKNPLR